MAMIHRSDLGEMNREAMVLDLGDLRAQGDALRARAKADADAIIASARAEHTRLVAVGHQEGFAKGLAEGLAAGHEQGLKAGREAGVAERREQLVMIESALGSRVDEFNARRDDLILAARNEVVRLGLAIAERIVKRAIVADPSLVTDQVAAVLGQLTRPTRVVLALHPADVELMREAMPKLVARISAAGHVELVPDASFSRGSCVMRTVGGGEIDATIETQLMRLTEALLPLGPGDGASSAEPGATAVEPARRAA